MVVTLVAVSDGGGAGEAVGPLVGGGGGEQGRVGRVDRGDTGNSFEIGGSLTSSGTEGSLWERRSERGGTSDIRLEASGSSSGYVVNANSSLEIASYVTHPSRQGGWQHQPHPWIRVDLQLQRSPLPGASLGSPAKGAKWKWYQR
jgi:hypothetical protein